MKTAKPSDPSSTRSEVTVEGLDEIAAAIRSGGGE